MRVLLVEDSSSVQDIFRHECQANNINLTIAKTLAEANAEIDHRGEFDLAICDIKLPAVTMGLDEDEAHGLAVLQRLINEMPSVPVVVLSAFGTLDMMSQMLMQARQIDIYGTGTRQAMLRFFQKAKLSDAVEFMRNILQQLTDIDQIELAAPKLNTNFKRAVRIFGRRKDASVVHYRALAGGRSGAQTGMATVKRHDGATTAHVVAKLTTLERSAEEVDRYRQHVSGRLGTGAYTDLSDEVNAGCGDAAGIFYSVADAYSEDLFTVLARDASAAADVVTALRRACAPWLAGAPTASRRWIDIRRNLISDPGYLEVASTFATSAIPDDKQISVCWTSQHGDLHGANVLVDPSRRPVLIDYGRTGPAPSTLDPVTLELSAIFHPDSPYNSESWPSLENLDNWTDLDAYLRDCPYPEFVIACREWEVESSVGHRDRFATVAAFCLRNLQYPDVDSRKALRLQQVAVDLLGET